MEIGFQRLNHIVECREVFFHGTAAVDDPDYINLRKILMDIQISLVREIRPIDGDQRIIRSLIERCRSLECDTVCMLFGNRKSNQGDILFADKRVISFPFDRIERSEEHTSELQSR